jgi:PhzF family phenazine biosynthesis protein
MKLPLYQVDAFTSRVFAGNPAAVVIAEEWLPDEMMQSIANENNLSETAFVVPRGEFFDLRWFTPEVEVDLCGHAAMPRSPARSCSSKTATRLGTRLRSRRKAVA